MSRLELIKPLLEKDLKKQLVSTSVLTSNLCFLDEMSRQSFAATDSKYLPFYYHLGKYIRPENMCEIGFRLGLLSSCFLKRCGTVKKILAFQREHKEYYSPRLAMVNVKMNYTGEIDFFSGKLNKLTEKLAERKWDLVFFNEEMSYDDHMVYLDTVWPHMNLGGFVVMEYLTFHKPAGEAYGNFCRVQNREPVVFSTRYGTGLVEK